MACMHSTFEEYTLTFIIIKAALATYLHMQSCVQAQEKIPILDQTPRDVCAVHETRQAQTPPCISGKTHMTVNAFCVNCKTCI